MRSTQLMRALSWFVLLALVATMAPPALSSTDGLKQQDGVIAAWSGAVLAENRLTSVSGAATATFVYDGDGNRVKTAFGSTTTVYVGNTYERDNGTTVRKYYYAGGVRVAMRSGGQTYYLLGDHLGGTNVTANSSGAELGRVLYRPWGEMRLTTGTTPTTWRFTGQREDATIELYYFNARYLDPSLGRFVQPDTIVPEPGDPQSLNRYSYVGNRPTRLVDPSGHCSTPSVNGSIGCTSVTGGATMPLVIDPATQPLTVAATGPQDTQQAAMGPARTAADDGAVLVYYAPAYVHPRAETVMVSGQAQTGLLGASAEVRRVTTITSLMPWRTQSYEEGAINGNMGPLGAEWTSQKGQTQPSFGIDLPIGDAQVQPGQVMAGITNPLGPVGIRLGFDFRPESVQTFITTRGHLDTIGGTTVFARRYASEGAKLWRMAYVRGTCVQGLGCFSGIEYTRWLLYNTGNPYAEVPQ